MLVDKILSSATYPQTKCKSGSTTSSWGVELTRPLIDPTDLGLQVLDNVIMTRWKVLPRHECQGMPTGLLLPPLPPDEIKVSSGGRAGIRNFVVNSIIASSDSDEALRTHRTLLNKLNLVLVSILKQEWPHNWPTFINEIISSCRTSLSICENNMVILRLLSEEVFDYSADQMTSAKTKNLKTTMCAEFSAIFQLCLEILTTAGQPSLLKATLETLLRFLNWIPLGYIFQTNVIETLHSRFLEMPDFRNITMKCLTEIAGLQIGPQFAYDEKMVEMFTSVLTTISNIVPLSVDLKATYPNSSPRDQEFVLNLALFLCNFFSMRLPVSSIVRRHRSIVPFRSFPLSSRESFPPPLFSFPFPFLFLCPIGPRPRVPMV